MVFVCAMIEGLESRMLCSADPITVGYTLPAQPTVHQLMLAAVATASPTASTATVTTPLPMGGDIQLQTEGTSDHAFVDLVKATTGFKNLSGGKATVDANGWPTQDFTVPLWATSRMPTGKYNMSFTGPSWTKVSVYPTPAAGKPTPTISKLSYNSATGVNTYQINVPSGVWSLGLKFTNTGGKVKKLRVLQPGYALSTTQVWTSKYINFLKSMAPTTLRMMDITQTVANPVADWAQRSHTTDANWTRVGVPWEPLIDLCNQVNSGLWLNVPAHATDDYVYQLATLVRTRLKPGLSIFVEYSNEIWALSKEQTQWAYAQAQAEVAAGGSNLNYDGDTITYDWGDRWVARRLMQISNIFKQNWLDAGQPSPINTQVKMVVGGQAQNPPRADRMLQYIQDNYGAPNNWFWSLGVAIYFTLNKYQDQFSNNTWTTLNDHMTTDDVISGMDLGVQYYENQLRFKEQFDHAQQFGLKLDAYELGVDTKGPFNIAAKKAATLDPRMKDLMERYVLAFFNQGGEAANWYSMGSRSFDTTYGTWSITNDPSALNQPKEQAFRELRGLSPMA